MRTTLLLCLLLLAGQAAAETSPAHTRTLAASCAACHGTQGNAQSGGAVLAGMYAPYFVKQMQDFKSGARPATVMHRHAKGLTADEIEALASYFAAQTPAKPATLKPQTLGKAHD